MKTKTQLKNTSSKRSLAMKKSWAERRNSPMREQARQRELAKLNGFIPAKKVTQRVNLTYELKDIGKMLADIGLSINEVRSMLAVPNPSSGAVAHSVEVSKRLDELRFQTKQAVQGIKQTIELHVTGFEEKLADALKKLDAVAEGNLANHNRLNKVEHQVHTEIVRLKRRRK